MKRVSLTIISTVMFSLSAFVISCSKEDVQDVPPPDPATIQASYSGEVDQAMASVGKDLFQTKCLACHAMDQKMVGPALRGVTQRRTKGWMNSMLEDPEGWANTDPTAAALKKEYNNVPMTIPGGTTGEERTAIIEYLRTEN